MREMALDAKRYWCEVERIAEVASRKAAKTGEDVYVLVDEEVESSACLSHEREVVAHSKNESAFHQWDPGEVEEGSDTWWWKKAFYAMAQDVYDSL